MSADHHNFQREKRVLRIYLIKLVDDSAKIARFVFSQAVVPGNSPVKIFKHSKLQREKLKRFKIFDFSHS